MADEVATRPCCVVRPCGCADARTVIDHLHSEIEQLRADRDRWCNIADGFAEAGTHPTAYDIALEAYEEARHG